MVKSRWSRTAIVAIGIIVGGYFLIDCTAYLVGSAKIVQVFGEEWSPDKAWGIRLCKMCNSVDGVNAWCEVIDKDLNVYTKVWLIGNYDDCTDVDFHINYWNVGEFSAQIGRRLYGGEIDIDVSVGRPELSRRGLLKGFEMPTTSKPRWWELEKKRE